MNSSDPIAEMLTRIRNAQRSGHETVEVGHSRMKGEITRLLKKEGYIADFVVEGGKKKLLRIYLRYGADHEPAIRGLKRQSTPGLRRYVSAASVPRVLGGMGTAVLSTPMGVMTGKDAYRQRVGGEYLCSVW